MDIDEKSIKEAMTSTKVVEAFKKVKKLEDFGGPNGPIQTMMKVIIEKMMEAERTEHLGYDANDRTSKNKKDSRNGYSKRILETSVGPTEVNIPRDRDGDFYPTLLEKYKKLDPNVERKIISLYSKGLSTRDVVDHIGEIYGTDVSPTLVSQVTNSIKDEILAWQARPLESVYSVIFFDAIFFKSRQDNKVVNKAAYTAFGISSNGDIDILGMWVAETQGARFWLNVLNELRLRGVQDILIACIDGLKGFPEANIFPIVGV